MQRTTLDVQTKATEQEKSALQMTPTSVGTVNNFFASSRLTVQFSEQFVRFGLVVLSKANWLQHRIITYLDPKIKKIQEELPIAYHKHKAILDRHIEALANRIREGRDIDAIRSSMQSFFTKVSQIMWLDDEDENENYHSDDNIDHYVPPYIYTPKDWRDKFSVEGMPESPEKTRLEVANQLAICYWPVLELTHEDVVSVLKKYYPTLEALSRLSDEEIEKFSQTKVDQDKYELSMILPDEDCIKRAVESLKIILYKEKVAETLDAYISWWNVGLFGPRHHNERAKVVRQQILNSDKIDEVQNILFRQEMIMNAGRKGALPPTLWNNSRWNEREGLTVKIDNPCASHYYGVVLKAILIPLPAKP